jgi:hypothetical protein
MGNITNIQKALDNELMKFGVTNGIDIAQSNIDKETSTDTPFLASSQINTGVSVADLGHSDERLGFYQVDVWSKTHNGPQDINEMADLLNETFKAGANFYHGGVCVMIDSFEPAQILISNGWAILPLTINWSSFTARL